ncbi:MAG: hypothetical protein FWB80_07405 [Defluviitaleaceae bacterium]|nr:hypothetical protein [Defluviitaleaceae bacterium]
MKKKCCVLLMACVIMVISLQHVSAEAVCIFAGEAFIEDTCDSALERFILPYSLEVFNAADLYNIHAFNDTVNYDVGIMRFDDETNIFRITDEALLNEIALLNNISGPEGTRIREIIFIPFDDENEGNVELYCNSDGIESRDILIAHIMNVRRRPAFTYHLASPKFTDSITNNHSTQPITNITDTITLTASSGFTSSANIAARAVTAGVGFNVNTSFTRSRSWTIPRLEPGERLFIEGTLYTNVSTFDVFFSLAGCSELHFQGTGRAWYPSGVRIVIFG